MAALSPGNVAAKQYAAQTLTDTGRYKEAVQAYRDIAHVRPQSADVWNNLGLAYQRAGDLNGAFQAFQIALKHEPKSAIAHNNLGVVYEKRGQLGEAVKEYKAALAINPAMPDARSNWARYAPSGLLTPKTNPLPPGVKPAGSSPRKP